MDDLELQFRLAGCPGPWWVEVNVDEPPKVLKITLDVSSAELKRKILWQNYKLGNL